MSIEQTQKQFALLSNANSGAQDVFDALMGQVCDDLNGSYITALVEFQTKPQMTAKEYETGAELEPGEAVEFLDGMCEVGLLSKQNGNYAATAKLQNYFTKLDAAAQKAFTTIFAGVSEADSQVLEAALQRVEQNCDAFIEQNPELFVEEDEEDECECNECGCEDEDEA